MYKLRATCLIVGLLLGALISHACPLDEPQEEGPLEWVKKDDMYEQSKETTSDQPTGEEQADVCPVCEQDFSYFRGFELECGHKFHEHCLNDWAKQSFRDQGTGLGCPVCTAEIKFKTGASLDAFNQARDRELGDKLREMWGVMAQFKYDLFKN